MLLVLAIACCACFFWFGVAFHHDYDAFKDQVGVPHVRGSWGVLYAQCDGQGEQRADAMAEVAAEVWCGHCKHCCEQVAGGMGGGWHADGGLFTVIEI